MTSRSKLLRRRRRRRRADMVFVAVGWQVGNEGRSATSAFTCRQGAGRLDKFSTTLIAIIIRIFAWLGNFGKASPFGCTGLALRSTGGRRCGSGIRAAVQRADRLSQRRELRPLGIVGRAHRVAWHKWRAGLRRRWLRALLFVCRGVAVGLLQACLNRSLRFESRSHELMINTRWRPVLLEAGSTRRRIGARARHAWGLLRGGAA
ncbi:hypothetical protein IE81DRAFT_38341 [Ceraceosorus guamensis]|uniref:Uncharacterized protein n=1 Tax=Ceraceosorus guamensis TaxID=1522189 RepID=A0A316W2U6_9BASI|nr:hypothetical protein IE81DRAFT_38341 [Ceraceosorus guamensis]PWN44217.1 hypothetical protein IE81DRAFT_38341 [Ceraceosorus guamensis]